MDPKAGQNNNGVGGPAINDFYYSIFNIQFVTN